MDLEDLEAGARVGGYVILVDSDTGEVVAVRPNGVPAVRQSDGRTIILLPAGKVVFVDADLLQVLRWLSLT